MLDAILELGPIALTSCMAESPDLSTTPVPQGKVSLCLTLEAQAMRFPIWRRGLFKCAETEQLRQNAVLSKELSVASEFKSQQCHVIVDCP